MLIGFGSSMGFERNGVLHLKRDMEYEEPKFILEMYK